MKTKPRSFNFFVFALKLMQDFDINMKALTQNLIANLFLISIVCNASAQTLNNKNLADNLSDKLELYGLKMRAPVLFIHFDKNVYTNDENVWFTGYFLNLRNQNDYKVLSLALVRDDDRLIVFNEKFLVNSGLVFGNTVIPDTTAAGHYSFIAYSNRLVNGKPDVLFTQRITIKRDPQTGFSATLNPLDTASTNIQQKVMLLVISNDRKKPVSKISANYYLGNSAHPVIKGDVKITPAGQYIFDIPAASLRQGENRLHVRIRQGGEVKDLNIDLPASQQTAVVHFFPEGGNLVSGLPNKVAWEVKGRTDQGLAVDAMLYEDGKVKDTVHTNSYGFGKFILTPKEKSVYSVKLVGINPKDTAYNLPVPIKHVPVLSLPSGIANDKLTVELNTDRPQLVYLNLHNYEQLFSSSPVNLPAGEKKISILLNDMPKGLAQITLTDSIGRPLAERLFFAHYDNRPVLLIETDKRIYKSREKVTVKLKLKQGLVPDSGLVSIACVQENRLQINNKNDIESYFYLKNQLSNLPVKENYLGPEGSDRDFLDDVLLIKGWSRYTWLDMLRTVPQDTVKNKSELVFNGVVIKYNGKIKKPVEVLDFNYPLRTKFTDSTGKFTLDANELLIERNKKSRYIVNGDEKQLYLVTVSDPYLPTTNRLVNESVFPDQSLSQQPATQLLEMTGLNRAIALKEVKIKGINDNLFYGGHNACGDYVCITDILNCPNHRHDRRNRAPVVGQRYLVNYKPKVYMGCTIEPEKNNTSFIGIYEAQEYYPSDLSQPDSPPEYLSTIYWKYLSKVTSEQDAEFSFYTNDITGRFKIVVQGCSSKDMVYGELSFEVKSR